MDWITVIAVAFGLALDAFAVSVGTGVALGRVRPVQIFRMAGAFGLFQFAMPLLGWLAGTTVQSHIAAFDHWVAFGLLALIGGKMIYEGCKPLEARKKGDPTRGLTLIVLAVATSIDALAVGLGMAFVGSEILLPAVIIGVVAAGLSVAGLKLGKLIGSRFSHRIEIVGGLVLLGIGVRILAQDLA